MTKFKNPNKHIIMAAIVIAACGTSFYAGMRVQKSKSKPNTQNQSARQNRQRPTESPFGSMTIGTVSNVSSTSISLTEARQNESTTYTINSDTKFIKDGKASTAAEIKQGDRVMIEPSTNDKTIAKRIIAGLPNNPSPDTDQN